MTDLERLRRERDLYLRLLAWSELDDLDALLDAALAVTVDMLDATLGYLCVLDDGAPAWERTHGVGKPEWSTTVIDRVLRLGEPVITDALTAAHELSAAQSVRRLSLEAVLALPLRTGHGAVVGVLYVHRALAAGLDADAVARAKVLARVLASHAWRLLHRPGTADPTAPWRARLRADPLVGRSQALADTLRRIARYARAPRPVLLTGPTGCGKSTVARVLHDSGPRCHGPFVELDCGAIADSLFESELFGTVAGAYTGAQDRPGLVEQADGGTLFLDELGNTSPSAQAALLRFLDHRRFRRTGDTRDREVDVAIVAATNADLDRAVEEGRLRADLLHRLSFRIAVPGLDARRDDLPELASALVELEAERLGVPPRPLATETVAALLQRPWPGHVRELGNVLADAVLAADEEGALAIQPWHVDASLTAGAPEPAGWDEALRSFKRRFLLAALARHGGNRKETAAAIGVSRAQLYQWLDDLGLKGA